MTRQSQGLRTFLLLIVLTLVSVLVRGYAINQSFYIPFIDHVNDAALFPGDPLFSFTFNNTLFFFPAAFFVKILGLEWAFFITYLIGSFLFVAAVFVLTRFLFRNTTIGVLAVLLLMIPKPSFGGNDATYFAAFYYNLFSIPLLLFSLLLFLKKKYVWSFALLGCVALFHVLPVIHLLVLYITFFVLDLVLRYRTNLRAMLTSQYVRTIFLSFVVFAVVASPLLVYKFTTGDAGSPLPNDQWLEIQRVRSPHHIFPSTWLSQFLESSRYVLLGLIAAVFVWRRRKELHNWDVHRTVFLLSIGFLALMALGTVFTELIPSEPFILAQLFRGTVFLLIFSMLYAAYFLFMLPMISRSKAVVVAGLLVGAVAADSRLLLVFLPLALAEILPERASWSPIARSILRVVFLLGVVAWLGLAANTFMHVVDASWAMLTTATFVSVPLFLITLLWLKRGAQQSLTSPRFAAATMGVFLIAAILVGGYTNGSFNFENQLDVPGIETRYNAWQDVQEWTHDNTPIEASIIVPPWIEGFRISSKRAIYGDWTDGTMAFFSHQYANTWYERMQALGVTSANQTRMKEAYRSLPAGRIIDIAAHYNQTYIVVESDSTLPFPQLYNNGEYAVLEIPREGV